MKSPSFPPRLKNYSGHCKNNNAISQPEIIFSFEKISKSKRNSQPDKHNCWYNMSKRVPRLSHPLILELILELLLIVPRKMTVDMNNICLSFGKQNPKNDIFCINVENYLLKA